VRENVGAPSPPEEEILAPKEESQETM